MSCKVHDFLYVGALNVFNDQELLKVLEAWKCRMCGAVLAGERPMGPITSSEGLMGVIEGGEERWLAVARKGSGSIPPDVIVVRARRGQEISVEAVDEEDSRLLVRDDWSVVRVTDGEPPRTVVVYDLLSQLKGYIDLSTWPPKAFTLQRRSPVQGDLKTI
ncbi:MAG: hypothetical protein QXO17_04185 [Nitrososphaerota archaeon]